MDRNRPDYSEIERAIRTAESDAANPAGDDDADKLTAQAAMCEEAAELFAQILSDDDAVAEVALDMLGTYQRVAAAAAAARAARARYHARS